MEERKYLKEEDLMNVIMLIPKNTVYLTVIGKVVNDKGEVNKVESTFTLSDINEMRKDFLDNLDDDDYNGTYTFTEKGEAYYDLLSGKINKEEYEKLCEENGWNKEEE